jgi:CBS domain-containing protein
MHPNLHRVWDTLLGPLRARGRGNLALGDVMSRDPRTCAPSDTLHRAAQIMWEGDCGCVPVVDSSSRVVGMITDRDVCMAAYTQGLALWQIPVSSAASQGVVAVRDSDTLDYAERQMQRHRLRRLPVLDAEGRVVGILSLSDLARSAVRGDHGRGGVRAEGVARTLEAICVPAGRSPAE